MQDMATGQIEHEDESGNGRDVAPGVALGQESVASQVYRAIQALSISAEPAEMMRIYVMASRGRRH